MRLRNPEPDMAYVISALMFTACVAALILMTGCTVTHETPSAERALNLADKITAQMQQPSCPTLDMLPVPQDVILDIKGDRITANAGGEQILRGYVQCRSLLR